MSKIKTKPLRVGFDFDGVLLYNPLRFVRPIIAFVKDRFEKRPHPKFHYPHNWIEREVWKFLHISSMFVAPGYEEVKKLTKEGKIEPYIITARYSFLKGDFAHWQRKLKTNQYFKGCFSNEKDEQPHIFKERMVKELDLDVFIDDNWDIVNYLSRNLNKNSSKKVSILWISNLFDKHFVYPYKFGDLRKAVQYIEQKGNS